MFEFIYPSGRVLRVWIGCDAYGYGLLTRRAATNPRTQPNQEVILLHSVMSGKKSVSYDGRTVNHTEEMARAFSYSWRDGKYTYATI